MQKGADYTPFNIAMASGLFSALALGKALFFSDFCDIPAPGTLIHAVYVPPFFYKYFSYIA